MAPGAADGKLYESFALGRIGEERFDSLLADYEEEQKSLNVSITEAEAQLAAFEEDTAHAEQFLALAKKYTDFSELTTPMINEFIDRIVVHAPSKDEYGDRCMAVDVYLNFIGRFELPAPELTPEEIKRQEQLKRQRIRSRERYQEIKAGLHTVGEPFQLVCKCCGRSFESKHSNALFCNRNCQSKYHRQEAAEGRRRDCTCENCGKVFTTTRNNVKYCCTRCQRQVNSRKQKEREAMKRKQATVGADEAPNPADTSNRTA